MVVAVENVHGKRGGVGCAWVLAAMAKKFVTGRGCHDLVSFLL